MSGKNKHKTGTMGVKRKVVQNMGNICMIGCVYFADSIIAQIYLPNIYKGHSSN